MGRAVTENERDKKTSGVFLMTAGKKTPDVFFATGTDAGPGAYG